MMEPLLTANIYEPEGAGSLVNKDIPDNCVVAGNPARVIMSLEEYHNKRKSAQEEEAKELVCEYRAVYGKDPDEAALSEFFWLFTNDANNLPEKWDYHMKIGGNYAYSADMISKNKTRYRDMNHFFDHCTK